MALVGDEIHGPTKHIEETAVDVLAFQFTKFPVKVFGVFPLQLGDRPNPQFVKIQGDAGSDSGNHLKVFDCSQFIRMRSAAFGARSKALLQLKTA